LSGWLVLKWRDGMKMDEITHAVPFKYIGAAHEKNYQHHLEQACLALHGQDKPVIVRIQPEPLNPMDWCNCN
jgi:hypothetical protein